MTLGKDKSLAVVECSRIGELVQADALDKILGLDQSTPGSVYQNDAILHFLDGVKLDQVVGGIHQRAVKGDQITLRQ